MSDRRLTRAAAAAAAAGASSTKDAEAAGSPSAKEAQSNEPKGKGRRERTPEPDTSAKRARLDEGGKQFTPELERVAAASAKADERPAIRQQAERAPPPGPTWRVQYSGMFDTDRRQLFDALIAGGSRDLLSVEAAKGEGGGRQREASAGVGVLVFTSEGGAADTIQQFNGKHVLGNTVALRFLTSTFEHLRQVPFPATTTTQLRAEATAGRKLLLIEPLPRQWGPKDITDIFAPASPGNHKLTGIKIEPKGDSMVRCWLEFDNPDNAARCLLRFRSQRVTTVSWAPTSVWIGSAEPTSAELPSSAVEASGSGSGP